MNKIPEGYLLVLEDDDEDFDTVMLAAKRANLPNEIRRAVNGDECVQFLKDWHDNGADMPLMALMDLNTPQGDGRYALRTLRSDSRFRMLPVVILSTSDSPTDLELCYTEGANAYHRKSVDFPAHLRMVTGILEYWLTGVTLPSKI